MIGSIPTVDRRATASKASCPVYRLFGLTLACDLPMASRPVAGDGPPDITFTRVIGAPPVTGWEQSAPVYASLCQTEKGESEIALYREPAYEVLRFAGMADFYLWPDRIVGHLLQPDYGHVAEILLLGAVLAYWQERQGVRVLHAAAVAIDDRAVGFVGSHGGGKSSLAAALMQAGHPLLSDDLLSVARSGGQFLVRPGYPQMRMWPDQVGYFLKSDHGLEHVLPGHPKRRVPVGRDGLGTFCEAPRPLACLYLPEAHVPAGSSGAIEITPVSPGDAVIELVRQSFVPNLVDAVGLQPQRLAFFFAMLRKIPMRRIRYPHRWEDLPHVRQAILEDLAGLPGQEGQ